MPVNLYTSVLVYVDTIINRKVRSDTAVEHIASQAKGNDVDPGPYRDEQHIKFPIPASMPAATPILAPWAHHLKGEGCPERLTGIKRWTTGSLPLLLEPSEV